MAYTHELVKLESQYKENPRRYAAPFADALRKNEEFDRALEVIRHGLELHPDYIPASVVLGRTQLDMGNDSEAEIAFGRVLELDQENVIALKALADIAERQFRFDLAEERLGYLLDVDRSNREAMEQLARVQAAREAGVTAPPPLSPVEDTPAEPPVAEDRPPEDAVDAAREESAEPEEPGPVATESGWNTWSGLASPAPATTSPGETARDADADPNAISEPSQADFGEMASDTGDSEDVDRPWDPWALAEEPEESIQLSSDGSGLDDDLGVVRSEEIVLRPSASSEFQAPSDSETLRSQHDTDLPLDASTADESVEEAGPAKTSFDGWVSPSEGEAEATAAAWDDSPSAADASEPDLDREEPAEADLGEPAGSGSEVTGPAFPAWGRETSLTSAEADSSGADDQNADSMDRGAEDVEAAADAAPSTVFPIWGRTSTSGSAEEDAPGADDEPVEAERASSNFPTEGGESIFSSDPSEVDVGSAEAAGGLDAEANDPEPRRLTFPAWSEAMPRGSETPSESEPAEPSAGDEEEPTDWPAWPDSTEAAVAPTSAGAPEDEPVMTETMAELYLRQGHTDEALRVYQALQARHPEEARYAERVRSLAPEAELVAPPSPHAAATTGGQSLGSFLGALLAARPGAVDTRAKSSGGGASRPSSVPASGPAGEPRSDTDATDATDAPALGTPTRPASDRLSLSAVFGDESSPVPPAIAGPDDAADSKEGPEGFSFDEFFSGASGPGGPRKSGSIRPSRGGSGAGPSDEDLDQFTAWLQSLKG